MFKEKMWTSQVYGHHDKMAHTKTHRTSQNMEYTKTQQTQRKNYSTLIGEENENRT